MHRMFIRIGIRKTQNIDDSLGSGTKLLLPSLSLGFRHEERETQFFYADCHLCWLSSSALNSLTQPTHARTVVHKLHWPRSGPKNQLASSKFKSQLLLLFKITKNPSPSLPDMTSFTSPVLFPIWGFCCDICDCYIIPVRTWTPALMSAPTHALSRKVLSLTKPKDKIYKTKNDNIKKNLPQLYSRIRTLLSRSVGLVEWNLTGL